MSDDPKVRGRFSVSDIKAQSKRERNRKLAKEVGFILLVWLTGAAIWLFWELF